MAHLIERANFRGSFIPKKKIQHWLSKGREDRGSKKKDCVAYSSIGSSGRSSNLNCEFPEIDFDSLGTVLMWNTSYISCLISSDWAPSVGFLQGPRAKSHSYLLKEPKFKILVRLNRRSFHGSTATKETLSVLWIGLWSSRCPLRIRHSKAGTNKPFSKKNICIYCMKKKESNHNSLAGKWETERGAKLDRFLTQCD